MIDDKIYYEKKEECLQRLRLSELETVKSWFKSGMQVLEIGGGSGYQACLMSSYGCKVFSIDIDNRPALRKYYHPVMDYNGEKIPFKDESFDLIFSSNVLEHIDDLIPIFTEIRRVLKPGGIIIHVLPSSNWRFWTSITHYANLLILLLRCKKNNLNGMKEDVVNGFIKKYSISYLFKRILFAGPHGAYPSAFSELFYFSKHRWYRLFKKNDFDIFKITQNGLFYTGYGLFPGLSLRVRKIMARFIGSSCNIFFMRPRPPGKSSGIVVP